MNGTAPMNLQALRTQALNRWRSLDGRERRLVLAAGVLIVLALVWWVGMAPALRTLRDTPPRLAEIEAQLQQMQRWAAESQALQAAPGVTPAQAGRALQAGVERLGSGARVNVLGDRATVTLQGIKGDALWAWLSEMRSAARARPVEAQLTLGAGAYSGTVVLQLPGGAP